MRHLRLQMQLTLDGFVGGPNGEQDWMTWDWDEELLAYAETISDSFDTIILGRKLAEGFIPYWDNLANDPDKADPFSMKIQSTPKFVFSENPETDLTSVLAHPNTHRAENDLVTEIIRLKELPGKDIITYGGAQFVAHLIKHNLVDSLHFFLNPVAIGKGLPIFEILEGYKHFAMKDCRSFDCGIVVLTYGGEGV